MPNPPSGTRVLDLSYAAARLSDRFMGTQATQQLQTRTFGPGVPLLPTVPTVDQIMPRQFQYPVSVNTQLTPRREYPGLTPFDQLRSLAAMYDVAALCIATRIEEMQGLPLHIRARDKKAQAAEQSTCDALEQFFAKPDRVTPYPAWIGALLYDLFSLDALTIYPHPDRGGGLWGLDVIDGSTVKPLLDARGQTAAYQQILYGTPWSNYERESPDADDDDFATFSDQQLIYAPRWTRSYTPYGFPPTEWIILRVNTALRKQTYDLAHFTDSNIPAGILSPPDGLMQPEQVAAFEQWWNAKLQGDQLAQQRIVFLPWNGKLIPLNALSEGGRYESSLDEWMLKITCAAFGVPPSEIGFTADVNKATSEGQEAITYRRGIGPLTAWLKRVIFDPIIRSPQYLGQPQLEAWFDFGESGDQAVEAKTQQADVAAGVITATESRRLRYPDLDGDAPGVAAPGGAPTSSPFERVAKASMLTGAIVLSKADAGPPDERARLAQEAKARKVIAAAYAGQQARIAAQLRTDPKALDWSAEPAHMAQAVLPLYESTAQQAAKQALVQIKATVEWGPVNQAALKLARQRATRFGDEVTATAQERTAARVADWIERGGTMPELIDSVAEVWSGPRADVAAATEITDIYARANAAAWQVSSVVQAMTWRTTNDELVCNICGPLADTEVDFDGELPPAHPGCRCWLTPVVGRGDDDTE